MKQNHVLAVFVLLLAPPTVFGAAESKRTAGEAIAAGDRELSETLPLAECHAIGWLRANGSPEVQRSWAWQIDSAQWQQAVKRKGEGKKEDCEFHLWMPGGIEYVKGIVAISGHGSGQTLYKHRELRKIARELRLALVMFLGNPVQRGFWPTSLLDDRLKAFGEKSQHRELVHAPLFLYGHSNGTGFSAIFPATQSARVWAWVSMRPGMAVQVNQPGAAGVPGMVMFAENDPYFLKPSPRANLAVVGKMRKDHGAVWHVAVEPGAGHGPSEKSWPLVFAFLRRSWAARVPADGDPRKGPVTLRAVEPERGYLGCNWDAAKGGYQMLTVAPYASFREDKTVASWLLDAAYAADWQRFQRDGQLHSPPRLLAIQLAEPMEYQVIQRTSRTEGSVRIRGTLAGAGVNPVAMEARWVVGGKAGAWQRLGVKFEKDAFEAKLEAPAGGWHRLELRATAAGGLSAEAAVDHVGVGEVFVVAGQSNSANHGEVKQTTKSRRVAAFDGRVWRIADDPQPGASGQGGSFLPPLGDEIATRFDVPVGFVACGIGATSVREWLPQGARFPNPPTIVGRVERLPNGEWVSKGDAYAMFVARMKSLGPRGFRAVLWHQGESDANQKDPSRTLPGALYRDYLERLIRESRRAIGWDAPWFVAQVSYHVPGDEASPEIRAAQASLWKDGVALPGPDSDALKGQLREANGKGVHFSDKGLREHGAKWAEKVGPWLERQLNL